MGANVCTCGGARSGKNYPALFDDDVNAQYIRMWWVTLAWMLRKHLEEFNAALDTKLKMRTSEANFFKRLNDELRGFLGDIYLRHDERKSGILGPEASRDLLDAFLADEGLVVSALRCYVEYLSLSLIFQNGQTLVEDGLLKARHTLKNEINSMCLSYKLNPGYYHTRAFQILDTNSDGRVQRDVFFACLSVGSLRFKEFSEALGFKIVDILALNADDPDMILQPSQLVLFPANRTGCFQMLNRQACFEGVHPPRIGRQDRSDRALIARRLGVPENVLLQDPCGNENAPRDYLWLQDVVDMVAQNRSRGIACEDLETGAALVPLFFLIGACPNSLSPMQAVMFSQHDDQNIDFWWVKPNAEDALSLEPETLKRHCSGLYKNDPGRSKPFLQQVADLFAQGRSMNGWQFGVRETGQAGKTTPRAFLQKASTESEVFYVTLMWQEDWTLNPLAKPFIKGKLVYQKDLNAKSFWSRQYEIYDGIAHIAAFEEGPRHVAMPGDDIKQLWELGFPVES